MTILVDQCVPRKFLRLLNDWGYQTYSVTEYIAANSSDQDVIALAQKLDAVLLTIDLDFANVIDYPPANYQGIIVARYEIHDEVLLTSTLKQMLTTLYRDELRASLIIVEPKRYRVRK